MATYFHGSAEIQADGLHTLYLMNPNYVPYSDTPQTQPTANMLFLNPAGNALNSASLPHAPPPPSQHFVGIPLPAPSSTVGSTNSDDHSRPSRFHYNLWSSVLGHTAAGSNSGGVADFTEHLGFRRPMSASTQQGLSLSLSPQQPSYSRPVPSKTDISSHALARAISPASGDDVRVSGNSSTSVKNGISGMQSVVLSWKYVKVAQELLDEVVNVRKAIETDDVCKEKMKMNKESSEAIGDGWSRVTDPSDAKKGADLTTAQRQELQMKKAKLVNILDEVEQRYRQYHHQMQIVVCSFEQAAGFGSAKSYTALALQTISKQFRCLKDAIMVQIKGVSKSLGQENCQLGAKADGSRLKFVDHQLRQQRALQQLGMIQHNAWRPQRGLPERAVSVLRAWLFEHFLHPYPKDSDKQILAKQTGLTRSQVSNWFINARVRLWKPMVEEMYMEETKDQEKNGSGDHNASKGERHKESGLKSSTAPHEPCTIRSLNQSKTFHSKQDLEKAAANLNTPNSTEISNSTMSTSPLGHSTFTRVASSDLEGVIQRSSKKPRSSDMQINSPSSILSMDMEMKPSSDSGGRDGYSLMTGTASHGNGFGTCPMPEIGRFNAEQLASTRLYGNSAVSLTLGLPHCENLSDLSGSQQNFLSDQRIHQLGRGLEIGSGPDADFCGMLAPQAPSHSSTSYENINVHDRKRFAAQLLPDFVA